MSDFVYTVVPGKLRQLLNKIRTVGVPRKVNADRLKTLGFTSLIGILKFIGMIDPSGVPTSAWSALRGAGYKKVLGAAVRQGYAVYLLCIQTPTNAQIPNWSTYSARARPAASKLS